MKKLLLFIILLSNNIISAQCIIGDCENGIGLYVYEDGKSTHQGQFVNGFPNGWGTEVQFNKDGIYSGTYTGDWLNGQPYGWGTEIMYGPKEGYLGTYTGNWINGDENGWGVLFWTKGKEELEVGNWLNGELLNE